VSRRQGTAYASGSLGRVSDNDSICMSEDVFWLAPEFALIFVVKILPASCRQGSTDLATLPAPSWAAAP